MIGVHISNGSDKAPGQLFFDKQSCTHVRIVSMIIINGKETGKPQQCTRFQCATEQFGETKSKRRGIKAPSPSTAQTWNFEIFALHPFLELRNFRLASIFMFACFHFQFNPSNTQTTGHSSFFGVRGKSTRLTIFNARPLVGCGTSLGWSLRTIPPSLTGGKVVGLSVTSRTNSRRFCSSGCFQTSGFSRIVSSSPLTVFIISSFCFSAFFLCFCSSHGISSCESVVAPSMLLGRSYWRYSMARFGSAIPDGSAKMEEKRCQPCRAMIIFLCRQLPIWPNTRKLTFDDH